MNIYEEKLWTELCWHRVMQFFDYLLTIDEVVLFIYEIRKENFNFNAMVLSPCLSQIHFNRVCMWHKIWQKSL